MAAGTQLKSTLSALGKALAIQAMLRNSLGDLTSLNFLDNRILSMTFALRSLNSIHLRLKMQRVRNFILNHTHVARAHGRIYSQVYRYRLNLLPFLTVISTTLALLLRTFKPQAFDISICRLSFMAPNDSPQ